MFVLTPATVGCSEFNAVNSAGVLVGVFPLPALPPLPRSPDMSPSFVTNVRASGRYFK